MSYEMSGSNTPIKTEEIQHAPLGRHVATIYSATKFPHILIITPFI